MSERVARHALDVCKQQDIEAYATKVEPTATSRLNSERRYLSHTDPPDSNLPVVQVVDSTDRSRMAIAKSELGSLLQHEHLASVPVLVLANKQDLPDAMNVAQLTEALSLRSITVDWHVQVRIPPFPGKSSQSIPRIRYPSSFWGASALYLFTALQGIQL